MAEPPCLTNQANITRINISPNMTMGPKMASFMSLSRPMTIAAAAATPATPKAYLTAGTAFTASLKTVMGSIKLTAKSKQAALGQYRDR
jgi:hypothetical protein